MKITCGYGDAGVLILPWNDFAVPLYGVQSGSGQDICDRENSAVYKKRYRGGHCDIICDHASQGFDVIKQCGYTSPAVVQTPKSARIYRWEAAMLGRNHNGLYACNGARLDKIRWADLIMYTCNDAAGKDITIVFFTLQQEFKHEIYKVEQPWNI